MEGIQVFFQMKDENEKQNCYPSTAKVAKMTDLPPLKSVIISILVLEILMNLFQQNFPSQNEMLLFSRYLAVPDSIYLPVLWQFLSSPISPFYAN